VVNPVPNNLVGYLSSSNIYQYYNNLFNVDNLGLIKGSKHMINLKDKSKTICLPNRRIPIAYESKVNEIIIDLLKKGVIRKSNSFYNSPTVVVPKKDGDLRLCIDYRQLNENTNKPSFYFPDTQEIFDKLGGNKFFSTLDLVKGYYQLQMHPDSCHLTAFSTPTGHYEFTRMPFGLCGAPFSFQKTLHNILSSEDRNICFVYLDDIIIFGKNKVEHDKNLITVLNKIQSAGIKLSRNKCVFSAKSVKYLGHIINENGIETDSSKTDKVKNWPTPKSVKDIQSFLGLANYYRRFVKNFSEIVGPLEACLGNKHVKFEWSVDMEASFVKIKDSLINAPILKHPSNSDIFILDTDASCSGIGAVLSQRDYNGDEHVIYYASNRLSKAEQKYCTTRKELLAIFHYTRFFRNYLLGRKFIIRTDHKSLTWLMSWKNPSSSQYFSWVSEISQFDFIIEHRAGKQHQNADALSRLQECNQCPLKHDSIVIENLNQVQEEPTIEITKNELKNRLPDTENFEIEQLIKFKKQLAIENETVYFVSEFGKLPIISNKEGLKLAKNLHSSLCHLGSQKMLFSLQKFAFWPSMKTHCFDVCKNCLICAERKVVRQTKGTKGSLFSPVAFGKVFMDIAGPLPDYKGYRYILGIVDSFSHFVSLIPLKTLNSSYICKKIENNWIANFGPPEQLHTDQGTNFSSSIFKQMCTKYNIKKTYSSPYHPQGNGMVERLFRTVKDMAYCIMRESSIRWPQSLSRIMLSLNTTSSKSRCSAYEILFGKSLLLSKTIFQANVCPEALKQSTEYFIEKCLENLKTNPSTENITIGCKVMVKNYPIIKRIDTARYSGPYEVVDVKSKGRSIFVRNDQNQVIQRSIQDVKLCKKYREEQKYEVISLPSTIDVVTSPKQEVQNRYSKEKTRYPKRITIAPTRFGFS